MEEIEFQYSIYYLTSIKANYFHIHQRIKFLLYSDYLIKHRNK